VSCPRLLRRFGHDTLDACVFWVGAPVGRSHPENAPPVCASHDPHSAPFNSRDTAGAPPPPHPRASGGGGARPLGCAPLYSPSDSAVLGWGSGACSPRLRVLWLSRADARGVLLLCCLCVPPRLRRVPARRCGRYRGHFPHSPFGLGGALGGASYGRVPLRYASGQRLPPRPPSTTGTRSRCPLPSVGTPAPLPSSDG
jgi:hypothetical protein